MSIPTSTSSLARLATTIDSDLGEVDGVPTGESASLIRVTRNGEVAVRSLDGDHPFDALLGFVAPDDWEVLGVIAPGWGHSYAPDGGPSRRVRVIHLASRLGEEASALRFAGDAEAQVMESAAPGRVADCLRRALELPTEPERPETLLRLWADRGLRAVAARAHPSFNGKKVTKGEVVALLGDRPTSWEDERWRVVSDGGNGRMDGALAAWMDDGMFARLVLGDLVELDIAMDAAKRACTPAAWRLLLETLTAPFLDPALEAG